MKGDHLEKLKVVVPVLSSLELDEITSLVLKYYPEVGRPEKKTGEGSRPYSASSLFTSKSGKYFLKKRNKGWRDRDDILWKHSIIEHLGNKNFPTPGLVSNKSGKTLTETEEHFYELFYSAEGLDIYHDHHSWMPFLKNEHALSAGKMLARFHLALEDFDISGRTSFGNVLKKPMSARFDLAAHPDLSVAISKRIKNSSVLTEFFKDRNWRKDLLPLLNPFFKMITSYVDVIVPWVSHGDWHGNNLFFENDRVSSVIDFHLADISFRIYDLAVAIDRNCIQWLDIQDGKNDSVHFDLIELILEGYNSVYPVSRDELRFLSILLPIHQLDLAINNIEYYLGCEKNITRAEWAYQVYLIKHLEYYQLQTGKDVVKFIENYCLNK